MSPTLRAALALCLCGLLSAPASAQELPLPPPPPSGGPATPAPAPAADVKEQVLTQMRAIIERWRTIHRVGNLGIERVLTQEAIRLGAPLFDQGRVEDCFKVYLAAAEACAEAFSDEGRATTRGREFAQRLRAAADRAQRYEKPAVGAWVLRQTFDHLDLEYSLLEKRLTQGLASGAQLLKVGISPEAHRPFERAEAALKDLLTNAPLTIPIQQRGLGAHVSRLHLYEGDFQEAGATLAELCRLVPDWPTYGFQLADLFPNPETYKQRYHELLAAVKAPDAHPDVLFLATHELYYLGNSEQVLALLGRLREADPKHPGFAVFSQLLPDSERQTRINASIQLFVNAASHAQGAAALRKEGRWAIKGLTQVAQSPQIPEAIRNAARTLITELERG